MGASTSQAVVVGPAAAAAAAAAAPWLDLPEALTEKILERLSISICDYIRFGAVCRRWRAIQRDHRLRHSPSSPPTRSIPWFIPYRPIEGPVDCSVGLLSSEQQRLHIPFSSAYLGCLEGDKADEGFEDPACSSLPYGWLLFDDWPFTLFRQRSYEFCLLNPITGAQISLPVLRDLYGDFKATISPPPRCDVLVLTADEGGNRLKLHLCRQENPNWTCLWDRWPNFEVGMALASVIYYDGKFYCIRLGMDFMVVDIDCPIEDHIEPHFLEMDQSLLPLPDCIGKALEIFLVESNGKMLLVFSFFDYDPFYPQTRYLLRFQLFEADLSNMRWVKADGLGDHALIIYRKFVVSLVAADVGVKRNCIYILDAYMAEEQPVSWHMFDLSTGEVPDAFHPFPPSPSTHVMFVPSIY